MTHQEFLECERKDCVYNCWGIISQYHCTKTVAHINRIGKCSDYSKNKDYKPLFKGDL
jgi:hypothetical protein